MRGWRGYSFETVRWLEDGVDVENPAVARLLELAAMLVGFSHATCRSTWAVS